MPKQPTTIVQLAQRNGHSPLNVDQSNQQQLFDHATNQSERNSPANDSPGEDWSSLTQDLLDTLPRVWTRGLLYLLVGFAGIILPWAMLAKVDQTGIARGRLEPQGQTYRLDAAVSGEVSAIAVTEGSTVSAGQVLVELDPDLVQTDLHQAEAKLEGQLNRLTQLEQIKNQLAIAIRTQQLQNEAQLAEQQAQTYQVEQRLAASRRAHTLFQEQLAKDRNEVHRYQSLWQAGVVPEIKVVEAERTADESQRAVEQAQAEIEQAQAELTRQQRGRDRVVHTGELAILDSQKQAEELQAQITDLQAELAQTRKLITSLQLQLQQRTIASPVDGIVFQLPIQHPGAVVQPGQTVAQIAPEGVALIFKAQMPSSESGFLQVGMPVKLKFDAYPFQDYGVVPGRVRWVSPDSEKTQTSQGEIETFELQITLDQTYILAENRRVSLTPGQTATAEVIVRQRRIIDFLLDPFKKLQQGDFQL
jgi:HlyD family secretion protein